MRLRRIMTVMRVIIMTMTITMREGASGGGDADGDGDLMIVKKLVKY